MMDRVKRALAKTKKPDPVKEGAKKLRKLGKKLAKQVESVTAKAGAQAVDLESKLLKAKKRAKGPAADIASVAKDLAADLRKQITKKRR